MGFPLNQTLASIHNNKLQCMSVSSNILTLQNVLEEGDLELRFHDGRSIKAHTQKLKLASRGGVLQNLIEDVVDAQITSNKRKRIEDSEPSNIPSLKVNIMFCILSDIYRSSMYGTLSTPTTPMHFPH